VGVGFLPAAVPVHFSGGPGDDQLRIAGGSLAPPDVTMDGGPGNDGMFIGQGLPAMPPATATVLGGDGNDEVRIAAGTLATADLGAGNDRFTVTGFGRAIVGAGEGNDRGVFAAATAASSRLAGGPGDDTMSTGRGLAAVSTCGPGRDRMQSVAEAVALDCELGDQAIALPGRDGIGPTTVTFSRLLTAGIRVGPVGLTGRLRVYFVADQSAVRRRVPRIGSVELRVRRGQTPTVRSRMSPRERARLGSRTSIKATLVAELRDAGHQWRRFRRVTTVRLPPR
jgi:hypothetical protein